MRKILRSVTLLSLIILTLFFTRDLMKTGLPMLHDSNPHIARMIAFHEALKNGQFPPMWGKELLGGIGSPVMMLNYQLPYFMTEGLFRLGFDYFESYKIVLALSLILSAVLMFFALERKYGLKAAWIGALIYSLAPYRFVDIYVRGALGESIAFMFPPLLIYGFLYNSKSILILGWAGLFLTHPVAAATFSAFFLGYKLLFDSQVSFGEKLKKFFVPYFVALAIAMFNLLPTIALTRYTHYSPSLSDTLLMFPSIGQLLHSPWGYGVSLPGIKDGMSFEIGIIAWLVLLIAIITAIIKKDKLLEYLSGATVGAIVLILPISLPLYELFLGRIIDFPWRLLMCIVFATSWMGAIIISRIQPNLAKWSLILGSVFLIFQSLPIAHTDKYWDKPIEWFARETGDSYGEYAPIWRESKDSSPFWERAEFIKGDGDIKPLIQKSNLQKYLVQSNEPGIIRINTTYFPGWELPSNCSISKRTLSHIDDSGLIVCEVKSGTTELAIQFKAPSVQIIGNLITLAGIGVYIWILSQSSFRPTTKRKQS